MYMVFLCLVELTHQCCETSTSEIYDNEEDKGKETCFGQWVPFPKLGGRAWVESNNDVLSVVGEES